MKSEREIRAYRDDLRKSRNLDCDCRRKHSRGCRKRQLVMLSMDEALSWILDENFEHDECVEYVAKEVRQ